MESNDFVTLKPIVEKIAEAFSLLANEMNKVISQTIRFMNIAFMVKKHPNESVESFCARMEKKERGRGRYERRYNKRRNITIMRNGE